MTVNATAELARKRANTKTPIKPVPTEELPADLPDVRANGQPQARPTHITIAIAPDGLHVRCEYTGTLDSIPAALEKLRKLGVLDLVQSSRAAAPADAPKPAASRVDPEYNAAGDACCPVHHKRLSEGDYGLFCSAKAKEGQVADKKGYCGLKFNA